MSILRWPEGRGTFVERDPERNPDGGDVPLRIRPGAQVDVDDSDVADHYLDRGFERVNADAADGGADDAESDADPDGGDDDADADGDDAAAEQGGDDFDVDAFVSRTPVSDVVDDITAGEADGYLDAVKEADDRVTVERAVDDRQAEIGGD